MEKVAKLLQEQLLLQQQRHEEQQEIQRQQHEKQQEEQRRHNAEQQEIQEKRHEEQMKMILQFVTKVDESPKVSSAVSTPGFVAFDSTSELWKDYWSRFNTFTKAHAVPEARVAQVILTNQTNATYKLLSNLAGQATPAKAVNDLTID